MAINKKLIHFKNFETFNSLKLSANEENTKYTLGVNGEVQDGAPDILYQSVVWIKDTQKQWTHGKLYNDTELYVFNYTGQERVSDEEYSELKEAIESDKVVLLNSPEGNILPACAIDSDRIFMYYSVYTTLGIIVILSDKTVLKELKSLATSDDLPVVKNGDGTKFLADDGTYKKIIHPEPYILNYSDTPYEISSEELEKLRNSKEVRLNYYTEGGQAGGSGISAAVYNYHYHNYNTDNNTWTFYIDENYNSTHDFVGYIQASVNYNSDTSTYILSFTKLKNETTYLLTSETYKYSDLEAAIDQGKQIIFQMTSDSQPFIVHELDRQSEGIMMGCLVMMPDGIGATMIMCGSDDIMFEPYTQRVIHLTGDGNSFLANDGTYKEIEIPQTNIYTCNIDSDHHTDYNALLEAINRGDQIFIKTSGLTNPYMCIPMYEESTNNGSILCYPHPIAIKQNSDIGFGGSVITVNSGGFCGYDSLELIIKNSGDGTRFLSDSGEYKEISIPSFEVPTKISELENDKGYLVKVVLTQAEYDALETKDPNSLYVISDANETEDNNFVTEAQLESRGFLTQTDRSELKEYDDFLLGKISDLESKLTTALGRIATLESELENTLKV